MLGQSQVNFVVDSSTKAVFTIFCWEEVHVASSSGSCSTSKCEDKTNQETKGLLCRLAQKIEVEVHSLKLSDNHLGLILKRTKSFNPHDFSNQ